MKQIKKELILMKKKLISTKWISNISNKNSHIFCDLSSLSQAYVFYKLSQAQVINKHYLKVFISISSISWNNSVLLKIELKKEFFWNTRNISLRIKV